MKNTPEEIANFSRIDNWTEIVLDNNPVDSIANRIEAILNDTGIAYQSEFNGLLWANVKQDTQQGIAFVPKIATGSFECVIPRLESKTPFNNSGVIGTTAYSRWLQKLLNTFQNQYYLQVETSGVMAMSNDPYTSVIYDLFDVILPPTDSAYQSHPLIKQGYSPITIDVNGNYVFKTQL